MAKFDLKKAILENKATFFGSLTEGQFSWFTQDTGQQIGSEEENMIPVYMFDDKGKYYYEPNYDGYGDFGGMDYYALLDMMNGGKGDRYRGIDLAFGNEKTASRVLFPALVSRPNEFDYKTHDFTQEPKNDPNQSWYAAEEDEDFIDQNDEEVYGYDDEDDTDLELQENKPNTKMKKSELTAKIREMVLAEMESNNMEDAPQNEVDFLAELEGMLSEEDGLTPLQDYVYQYEIEISGEDEAQEFLYDIKQLKTPQDVYDFYAYDRDWSGSDLNNIFRQVKRKFANLITSDDLTPLQRTAYSYTKERFGNAEAKKSLDQIKTLTTREEFTDWVKKKIEAENSLNEAKRAKEGTTLKEVKDDENGLTPLQNYVYNYEKDISGEDEAQQFLDDIKKLNTPDDVYDYYAYDRDWEGSMDDDLDNIFRQVSRKFKNVSEAKDEEVADEEVEVTDDFSMEEPQGPGKIDVTQNANADLTGTKKEVQDNLEAALEAARALGDEKLATQVGNTITFFNKQHVVKDTPVAENLNESMFPMLKKILK
jgi:hypothetical protein